MKKRIILIGAIYYRNLGDAALCYSAQGLLEGDFDVTLLDIYGRTGFPPVPAVDTENCRSEYDRVARRIKLRNTLLHVGVVPFDRQKKQMFERMERQLTDEIARDKPAAIVFAGGALIKGVFINSIVRIAEIARLHGIPVVFNACGIDAEMLPAEWKKIGSVLQDDIVRYISVRDGFELLSRKYPDLTIHDTFDPAICADRFFEPSAEKNGIGLGIMLSHRFDYDMQTAFWGRLIRKLNAEGRDWRMFTNGAPADQSFAAYILRENNESESRLVPCPETAADLYRNISAFEGIVSMRLHSHILAYSSGTPSVAVSWDQKIDDFFAKIEKTRNCLDFNASADDIIRILDESISDAGFFNGRDRFGQSVDAAVADITAAVL